MSDKKDRIIKILKDTLEWLEGDTLYNQSSNYVKYQVEQRLNEVCRIESEGEDE